MLRPVIREESLNWFASGTKELFLLMDHDGRIKYINPSFEKLLQYSFSEVGDRSFLELVHPEDKGQTTTRLLYLKEKQRFVSFVHRCRCKNGTYVQLHWEKAGVTEDGLIQAIAEPMEKHLVEDNASIAWPSTFFDLIDGAADIVDLNGKIIFVNDAFKTLYGCTPDTLHSTIPKYLKHEFAAFRERLKNGEKVINHRTFRIKKDGTIFPVSLTLSPVYDLSGKVTAISAITRDLTEVFETKMLVEIQNSVIEEREKLLLDITENIKEVICLFDIQQCKFLYISPSYEKLWGISVDQLYENPASMFGEFHQEDLERMKEIFLMTDNVPREMEYKIKGDKEGEEKWIRTKVTPVVDEHGIVTRNISVSEDITEWKTRDMMIKKRDELGVVGQLAAGIAHEIRNPLTSVKGFVQLLGQETNNKYSEIILSELERIEFILNEFLVMAKPDHTTTMNNMNMNQIVKEILVFMNPEALLNEVEIKTDLDENLPHVNCEPKQLKQVLINLIKNAIEAMPTGGNIYVKTSIASNGFASIEVRDEGTGIPQEQLDLLGKPFFTTKEKGMGLGLMVSYKIIENHKGTIQFTSKEGKGAAAHILLPPAD
ncbi:PAS domain-containing sensor histidine kinase [Bacillus aerolatus]|nr:PAS domain-containing sensor histidine kinase [Bacillus aerolatus]